jgi:hypothetical protein
MTGRWNWLSNVNNGHISGTAMKVLVRKREHTDRVPKNNVPWEP